MSGQGSGKGQQSYGQQAYADPNALRLQQQQMNGGYPMNMGGGYFSAGNSNRARFGQPFMGGPGNGPVGGPPLTNPFGNPGGNPFGVGGPGGFFGNNFGNSGNTGPQPKPLITPMNGSSAPAQPAGQSFGGVPAPTNPDPNSQEYAQWYYSLAPSTRAYAAAPGSQTAQNQYNSQFVQGAAKF